MNSLSKLLLFLVLLSAFAPQTGIAASMVENSTPVNVTIDGVTQT